MNRPMQATMALMILLAIAPLALGLGASPAKHTLDFEADKEHTLKLRIHNNENKDMRLAVYAKGDLAE